MDNKDLSKISAIALNNLFGYEPKFSHRITDSLGSAEAVFSLPQDELLRIFGPYNRYLSGICESTLEEASRLYERLLSQGYNVISIYEDSYPALLRDCDDAPMVLYVRSGTDPAALFNTRPAVSIVGTRDMSLYGKEWCTRIVKTLSKAPQKPLIISGMAIGIDITAHTAALDFGLPTIGVLPVGIDDVYPRRHIAAAKRIAEQEGGALITDYPPGTDAVAVNFLRRNRIIAGISQATILVESKAKGGGTLTARLASGYGRDVFTLPGRIDDLRSEGCNRLLREKIAEPIASLDGLAAAVGLGSYSRRRNADLTKEITERFSDSLERDQVENLVKLALQIKAQRGICYDELCRICNLSYSRVSTLAGLLENEGFIQTDLMQRCSINAKKY